MADINDVLGMPVEAFLKEVNDLVQSEFLASMENFKTEALKLYAKRSASTNPDEVTTACSRMRQKLMNSVARNNEKFNLYCTRNIFTLPEAPPVPLPAPVPENPRIAELRARYEALQAENHRLVAEVACCEQTFAQMKDVLFKYHIGLQTLAAHGVEPLSDTVQHIIGRVELIRDMTSQAEEIITQVASSVVGTSNPSSPEEKSSKGERREIATSSVEDIVKTTRSLR